LTSHLSAGPTLKADFTEDAGTRRGSAEKESGNWPHLRGISEGCRSAKPERVAPESVWAVERRHCIYLNKFFLRTISLPSTTPAAADACISAMLSLAVVKSRGPLPAGGRDCSTLRSTIGRNGASFCAKRGWT